MLYVVKKLSEEPLEVSVESGDGAGGISTILWWTHD